MLKRNGPILTFCHIRKTGGITFNQILRREFGLAHLDGITRYPDGKLVYRERDLKMDALVYPGMRSLAGHGVRPFLDYGEFSSRLKWLTILRDPVRRYVSHFTHHVENFGCTDSFQEWMQIEKHHNDQTKTIAGSEDLEKAKSLLQSFEWVGFTGDYSESLKMLESRFDYTFSTTSMTRSNVAKGLVDKELLLRKFGSEIRARNSLDIQLCDFARSEIWSRQQEWGWDQEASKAPLKTGVFPSRLKRNLIYKPFVKISKTLGF